MLSDKTIPIGAENVILRGCMVRSCQHVWGLVIFTGPQTKLMQNNRQPPVKVSNMYKVVNKCIFLIFFTQFVLCIISVISFAVWNSSNENIWYLPFSHSGGDIVNSFFTFLILFNNLVPISLYVSLDMIKV